MPQLQFAIRLSQLLFGAVILVSIAGCGSGVKHIEGSGQRIQETRELEPFDSIRAEGIGTIKINYGKSQRCIVNTDDNLLEHYKTTVKNNVLTLSPNGSIRPSGPLAVAISCEYLKRIEIEGAIQFELNDFQGTELEVVADGSCSLTANGQATHLELTVHNACELDLFKLKTKTSNVALDGASSARVFVEDSLTANVQGAASLDYKGKAKLTKSQDGVGTIRKR